MVNDARADGGRCPRCGARCGCGGVAVLATHRCARRAAVARAPSSPLRLVRPLAPAGADGGAVGAQKAARPSRRVRCAPPVAACVRRSRAAAAVGRSAARSPLKRGLIWLVSPRSLPAAAPAPASVCAASSGGGACSPLRAAEAAAAPPPPPPVKCWGRGLWLSCVRCGGVAPAAAGARSSHGLSLGIIGHTLRKMVGGVETYA